MPGASVDAEHVDLVQRTLVGLARAASVHLMPQAELFVIYLIMAAVLMIRPEGLFKRETARRI